MPQGLQVFDADENITLDLTDRLTKLEQVIDVPTGLNGAYIDIPGISPDTHFVTFNSVPSAVIGSGNGSCWFSLEEDRIRISNNLSYLKMYLFRF